MSSRLEKFSLLLICFLIALLPMHLNYARGQSRSPSKVVIRVTLKDKDLNTHFVENFGLIVQKLSTNGSPECVISSIQVVTASEGAVSLALLPGDYVVKSEKPLVIDDKAYEWAANLKVESGKVATLDLSNDNATITPASTALKGGRITEEADLLTLLRNGVVTVQGELRHGTGFIVDDKGLIITNQHLISNSKELRVQFDNGRKVQAKLLAEDPDRNIAVLWVNLDACPSCKTLTQVDQKSGNLPVSEGERVFTISSTSGLSKILTSGVITRAEQHAIISDISINTTNTGGPLFNKKGEVVGINSFRDQERSGAGASGSIRIEAAQDLLAKAKLVIKDDPSAPSSELLPTEPENSYPVESLTTKVNVKSFEDKPYKADVGKYQVTMITPVLKHYIIEKDRAERARQLAKAKQDGAKVVIQSRAIDSFYNLRNWAEYVSHIRPVVHILVIPEVKATGKSLFFGILGAGVGAMGGRPVLTPLDFKFKADFYEMSLVCDGKTITPIQRGKIEYEAPMQSYFKIKTRSAYAGLYTYSAEAFDPSKCQQLELQILSEENPAAPERELLKPRVIQKVWGDFDSYRQQLTSKQ